MPKAPKSLSISRISTTSPKCSLNVLPCHINHTGPVDASSRYWRPTPDVDDTSVETSYFRGRKLRGRKVAVPEGYEGVILKKTDRTIILSTDDAAGDAAGEDADDLGDETGEEAAEELQVAEQVASFNHITVWSHESLPDQNEDVYVRGLGEWIALAGAIHDYDDESSETEITK